MTHLIYAQDGHLATLTLNRPEAANAYSEEMIAGILAALDRAEADPAVRALIVTGAGKAFSAGGDLRAMHERSGMFAGDGVELRQAYIRGIQAITRRFARLEKPVIAALNGSAIGAGLGLALVCDIRICSDRAKLGSTFARVGLIPGDGSAFLLSRIVGFPKAVDLLLSCRVLDAAEAERISLVHRVVPADRVMDEARAYAAQLAALPPKAVQMTKSLLYRTVDSHLDAALELTSAMQGLVQTTEDHECAVAAMLEALGERG